MRYGPGGVVTGRQNVEREVPIGVAGRRVARASGDVDEHDRGLRDEATQRIENGAADGAGGGVLSAGSGDDNKQ